MARAEISFDSSQKDLSIATPSESLQTDLSFVVPQISVEPPIPDFLREEGLLDSSSEILPVDLPSTTNKKLKSNTQSEETIASTKMAEKRRMVIPWSKDAPKFNSSNPAELKRFIERMEDQWAEAGITEDVEKKKMIGKYADMTSEIEWTQLDNFDKGSWNDFKKELIANYPEAAAAERGTPARIRELCAETSKIRLGDLPALYRFKRAFLSEAKKLRDPPQIMSNRELVELFIGCLSEAMASAVLQYLGNKSPSTGDPESDRIARRPEDKYDLQAVCKAAIEVLENSQGMFELLKKNSSSRSNDRDVFLFNQPTSESKVLSEKVEELEGVQALERDRLVSMNKMIETRISELENLIKSLVTQGQNHAKGDCKNGNCKMHEASSNSMQKGGKSLENEKCFWCGFFGHFQADCEDLKNQIRLGNVKLNQEGKLRLRDGSFIPKYPSDATLKERVERHYAKKPSQFYYGEYEDNDPTPSTTNNILSQLLGTSNDMEKRTLTQLKAELDLKRREEALELKKRLLAENERMLEQANAPTKTPNIRELLEQLSEEELAVMLTSKSGFH